MDSVSSESSEKSTGNSVEIEYFLAGYRTVPKVSDFLLKGDALKKAKELAVTKFDNDINKVVEDMQSESSVFYEGLPKKIVDIAMFGVNTLIGTFYLDKDKLSDKDGATILGIVDELTKDCKSTIEVARTALLYYKLDILENSRFENYGDGSDWEPKKARANQKADIYELKADPSINLSLRGINFR